jgi:hypothetical protein
MVTPDRIRLTGLLRKTPQMRGFLFFGQAWIDPSVVARREDGCGVFPIQS